MKESTERLLLKATRAIEAAGILFRENSNDFAAGRAYYGMFYVAEALLNERGLHFRKHSAVHAAFGEQFAKTAVLDAKFHRWLLDASDKRLLADYEVEMSLSREDVEQMIVQAKEFLGAAQRHLNASGNPAELGKGLYSRYMAHSLSLYMWFRAPSPGLVIFCSALCCLV